MTPLMDGPDYTGQVQITFADRDWMRARSEVVDSHEATALAAALNEAVEVIDANADPEG